MYVGKEKIYICKKFKYRLPEQLQTPHIIDFKLSFFIESKLTLFKIILHLSVLYLNVNADQLISK